MAETAMVERVARALMRFYCVDQFLRGDAPPPTLWAHAARAAIEAMREPPLDVLTAFVDAETSISDAKTRWAAAIDAALSPSKV